MMSRYIAKNAKEDKSQAELIVATLNREIRKTRFYGWLLVIVGIILLAIVIGIVIIPMGILKIYQANRATKIITDGYEIWIANNA